MRITISERLLEKYPTSRFIAIKIENYINKKIHTKLEKEKKKLQNKIREIKKASEIKRIKEHKKFHDSFGKSYHIEFQLQSIIDGKEIPTDSILSDILFMIEMKHYLIISVQDIDKIKGNLKFDLSDGGEKLTLIGKKVVKLKSNDIVLKDDKGVLISHLYGPGESSKVTPKTKNSLYLLWFVSPIDDEDIDTIINDLKFLLNFGASRNTKIKVFEVEEESEKEEFIVTPWEVKGHVDYKKLIRLFGTTPLKPKLLNRLKKHTGKLHHFLTRKKFFSHRDFDVILDYHEKGKEFALYTGRGPSGNTHLGHLIPWIFTKWLQDKFKVELYFEITDAEKYLIKDLTLEQTKKWSYENILDIIAIGFDPDKTFIFLDTEYGKTQFRLANEIAKKITFSTARAVFGFTNDTNIGLIFHPAVQAAPCYLPTYLKKKKIPVLIPAAIDQDPYWRVTRDIASKIGFPKPCQIHCSFLPGLGEGGKMSASDPNSAIYTTDDPKTVHRKIMKHAFSGGRETIEEHRKYGGNPDVDIAYQYLTFLEENDKKLEIIHKDYKSGKLLTGELKQMCIDKINEFLADHQKRRKHAKKNIEKFMLRD